MSESGRCGTSASIEAAEIGDELSWRDDIRRTFYSKKSMPIRAINAND